MMQRGLLVSVLCCVFNQCSAFNYGDPNEVQIAMPAGTDYAVVTSTTKPKVGDTITFVKPNGDKEVVTIVEIYGIKVISSGGRRLQTVYQTRLRFSPPLKVFVPAGSTVVISSKEEKWCDKTDSYADYAAMNKNQKKAWEACKMGCTTADYALIGKSADWKKVAAVCKGKKLEQKFEIGTDLFNFQGPLSLSMMAGMGFIVSLGLVAAAVTALRRQRRSSEAHVGLLPGDSDDNVAE